MPAISGCSPPPTVSRSSTASGSRAAAGFTATDCRHPLCAAIHDLDDTVCGYLEKRLRQCCDLMGLPFQTVRTSSLGLDPSLAGADRVIAAARALGADSYVNLEGGSDLYDASAFEAHGMRLRILPAWQGPKWSILHRLLTEPADAVAREIREQV